MKGRFQALLLVLMGAGVLRISLLSELYLRYVKSGLRPLLVVTGGLLLALGLAAVVREAVAYVRERSAPEDEAETEGEHEHRGGDGHDHAHGPRVAWLLYVPAVMLLLFAPPALGAYTAARDEVRAESLAGTYPALPESDPLPLSVRDFSSRAVYDTGASLRGRTVRMTGFVTPGEDGRWYLSRLLIQCCAADTGVLKVEVHGSRAPSADTWVTVTGIWRPTGPAGSEAATPALNATAVKEIPAPTDPYDDRAPSVDGS